MVYLRNPAIVENFSGICGRRGVSHLLQVNLADIDFRSRHNDIIFILGYICGSRLEFSAWIRTLCALE